MGLIHIYCGDGKGKTSAAIGLAVRMAGYGKKVVIARFLKTDHSGEVEGLRGFPTIHVIPVKKSFGFVFRMDEETKKKAAEYQKELLKEAFSLAEDADLLILDEIIGTLGYGMVSEEEVIRLLEERSEKLEVVMTGRNPSERLLQKADYVSEIVKRKHPYDHGISAREGIEY